MRRGLYVLMMVVLVLRGLTGTAMAAGVLPPLAPLDAQHAQHQAQEQTHHHDEATTSAACDTSTAGCAAHEHGHHTAACSACEICHSAMLDAPATPTPGRLSPGPQRPLTTAQFDSAPLALAIKPPIA